MRIFVEDRPGYPGWKWVDVTNEPMPTLGAQRARRIMVEEAAGYNDHEFHDVTDVPMPSVIAGRSTSYKIVDGHSATVVDGKPVYRIPSTAEILASPPSGYRAVGTFSGCGGSSLGLTWAGLKVIRAYEFDAMAARSYAANFATPVDVADLRKLSPADVLTACDLQAGELDVFEGSPPCSKFSLAGKREKSWNRTTGSDSTIQQANVEDLFFEWVRLLAGIQPRVALAENVYGLAIGKAKGHLKLIVKAMRDAGYRAEVWDLDAQWLGTPQRRRRLIFVGVRNDLAGFPVKPTPLPYRFTVADALPHLISGQQSVLDSGYVEHYAGTDRPVETICSGPGSKGGKVIEARQSIDDSGHVERFVSIDQPSATISSHRSRRVGQVIESVHSFDGSLFRPQFGPHDLVPAAPIMAHSLAQLRVDGVPRRFTIDELKRLCGFPDDFELVGNASQQWARLGNAVMPPMYRHVGASLVEFLRTVDAT